MTSPTQTMAVQTFTPMLRALSALLDKAGGLGRPDIVEARLAPDMYPLARQVQIACDQAKNAGARLAGQTPPAMPDEERSLDELKAHVAKTIAYLEGLPAAAFEGADARQIVIPGPGDLEFHMNGLEMLRDWTLPNFYFHVVTAYDILRHEGLEIGKPDYVSHLARYLRQREPAQA